MEKNSRALGPYGPGWGDVAEALRAFSREWGGDWVFNVRSAPRLGKPHRMWIVCIRRGGNAGVGVERELLSGTEYPHCDGISMPAVMHGLLYDVHRQLEEAKIVAERQATS